MAFNRFPFFKELWKQNKYDRIRDLEEVDEDDSVLDIFGTFGASSKRLFSDKYLVLGIRPLENWFGDYGEELDWFKQGLEAELGVLFEHEDGGRFMGIITRREYEKIGKIVVGEVYMVEGIFEFIKLVKELDVYLFFRIRDIKI